MKKRMVIGLVVVLAVIAALVLLVGPALAQTCSSFNWVQTYNPEDWFYWGPAVYYGQTVTVVYTGTNCSHFQDGRFNLKIDGTATVYAGSSATGTPIDVRDFHNSEQWYEPANTWGWPVSWYACGVKRMYYRWSIPGVYDFVVTAKDGYWTIETTAHTAPPTRGGGYPDTDPLAWDACP